MEANALTAIIPEKCLCDHAGQRPRADQSAYIAETGVDIGADIFNRGLCLPSDNKMTAEQQDTLIEIVRRCFG